VVARATRSYDVRAGTKPRDRGRRRAWAR